jgi:cytochrome c5
VVIGTIAWAGAMQPEASVRSPKIDKRYDAAASPAAARAVQSVKQTDDGTQDRALLQRYCASCHNSRLKSGGLILDKANSGPIADPAHAELWEKVVRKLRTGAMPPPGVPRPDQTETNAFSSSLEAALDRAAKLRPNPRRPPVHRLNRTEYTNAVRDLLAIDIDPRSILPPDNSGVGFDNIADVLSVTPGLLERYMSAATKISRLAVGDPTLRPVTETYTASPLLVQDDRMSEDLPFGSRGGMAIRHLFPLDGEYTVAIRLQRTYAGGTIRGLAEPVQLDVRLDGTLIKSFTLGEPPAESKNSAEPSAGRGARNEYRRTADDGLEVRFRANAGARVLAATFANKGFETEGVRPKQYPVGSFSYVEDNDVPASVDHVKISGPFNAQGAGATASRRRIFTCYPSDQRNESGCARQIIQTLTHRAYRRPATDKELAMLSEFYEAGRVRDGFDAGVQSFIARLLVDPNFLFRIERDPAAIAPGTPYHLSDLDIASRLSFFLWSSLPDDELLSVAEAGKLRDPRTLDREVSRLLADPKSYALVSGFTGQWLYLRNLRGVTPDPKIFSTFDDNLREAFQRETELFVKSTLDEDRPVSELLTAPYTFLNERLASHYGIPGVYGSHFRRVALSGGTERAGLLGHASILTVTSYATRTSPVLRGKWLLENLLGSPPPPPPPNVPDLKERNAEGRILSLRQRMEQHRRQPQCASCHSRMDPLGFALENFDAVGRWRDVGEDGNALDVKGMLPDGATFDGPEALRKLLQSRQSEFVTTLTEKLMTYALGRALEYSDAPAVRAVMESAAPSQYRWSALIRGIVASVPFQMRMSRPSSAGG